MCIIKQIKYKRLNVYERNIYGIIKKCDVYEVDNIMYYIFNDEILFTYYKNTYYFIISRYIYDYLDKNLFLDIFNETIVSIFSSKYKISYHRFSSNTKLHETIDNKYRVKSPL